MAVNIIKRTWHQNQMVKIEPLNGFAFQAESGGHTFQISGVDDSGNAVPISGTIAGVFLRPDNTDVALTGSASGGVASVTLKAECYAVPGRFLLTVYATSGSNKGTIYAAMGTVSRTSSGAVSPAAASDVVDLVNRINAATATIPASYTTLLNAVAGDYSDTKTYAVKDFVWYNGHLYRCTTAITTAETWTASHWTQVVLADALNQDITDLKSAIDEIPCLNIYDPSTNTDGKYIGSAGVVDNSTQGSVTDYIPITKADNAVYEGANPTNQFFYLAYYNADKNFIGVARMKTEKTELNSIITDATAYVRFSVLTEYADKFRVYVKRLVTVDEFDTVSRQVTENTKRASLIIPSANMLDVDNLFVGSIKRTTGELNTNDTGWRASDYIAIEDYKIYVFIIHNSATWVMPANMYYAFYDADKTYTHGGYTTSGDAIITALTGDAYIRISASNTVMTTRLPMFGEYDRLSSIIGQTDQSLFIRYGNSIKEDLAVLALESYKTENETNLAVRIVLPDTIPIAVGRQITFYKPNFLIAKNPDDFVCYWSTTAPNKTFFDEGVRFEPAATGNYTVSLEVFDRYTHARVANKTSVLKYVADTQRTGKKVLFIGDSLTNAGFYPYEIQKHLSGEGVESIGTVTTTAYLDSDPAVTARVSVNHEGRGGWSAQDYITKASKSGVSNAFWNPDTSAFDFAYYLTQTGFAMPDVVCVNLGTNGTSNPDAEISAIKTIISAIRTVSASVPIIVSAIPVGDATESSYIDIYLAEIREKQISELQSMSNVFIAPIYLNVNRLTDWKTHLEPESSRNALEVTRQYDGVHPSKYGYFKFADVYWSVIQYIMGL